MVVDKNLGTFCIGLLLFCKVKESSTLVVWQEGIDVGTLLKSTCNTFLKTLEECMQIANAAFTSELLCHTPPGSPQLATLKSSKVGARSALWRQQD